MIVHLHNALLQTLIIHLDLHFDYFICTYSLHLSDPHQYNHLFSFYCLYLPSYSTPAIQSLSYMTPALFLNFKDVNLSIAAIYSIFLVIGISKYSVL